MSRSGCVGGAALTGLGHGAHRGCCSHGRSGSGLRLDQEARLAPAACSAPLAGHVQRCPSVPARVTMYFSCGTSDVRTASSDHALSTNRKAARTLMPSLRRGSRLFCFLGKPAQQQGLH